MSKKFIIIIATIAFLGLLSGLLAWGLTNRDSNEGPLISTDLGLIRGLNAADGDYYKFLGIPYAVVNERNPFGPATPHPGFDTIFEAYEIATPCPQMVRDAGPVGNINCLELDIYVPQSASSDNRLPVLVWIHGGGWVEGSTQTEGGRPQFLVRHDVIVVSINYRLGIFGFLCIDSPEAPGNQGLKDQVLALRWVRNNIEAFGGDATRITAFGESAGGMSTNLHLYSQYEKLFDQAIIQSGPVLSYWMFVKSHPHVPFQLAEHFGYNASDISDAMSYLSNLDTLDVLVAAYELKITRAYLARLTKPCVEKTFDGVENFVTEHPMNIRGSAKVASTRIIIGYNSLEIGNIIAQDADFFANYSFTDQFYMGFPEEDFSEALKTVKHFYIGDSEINIDMRHEIADYASDIIFAHSTRRMIDQFVEDQSPSVFSYVFSHVGRRNVAQARFENIIFPGALHADELGYLFDLTMFQDPPNPVDQVIIDRMTTLWANFVKYGDPTPETTELLPFKWTPVSEARRPHLDINENFMLRGRPIHSRIAFWDLFYKLYAKYQMWYKD